MLYYILISKEYVVRDKKTLQDWALLNDVIAITHVCWILKPLLPHKNIILRG